MIIFFTFFLSVFVHKTVWCVEIPKNYTYDENSRYFYFPGEDENMYLIDKEQKDMIKSRFNPETDMLYLVYTRNNSVYPYYVVRDDDEDLHASNFNITKPIKIIVHGWRNSYESRVNKILVPGFLDAYDVNVIVVDWRYGASGFYTTAVSNVPRAGAELALFVEWLIRNGASISSFHLLGFSLGAHLVGIAGRHITSEKIPYITAFDPAAPLWGIRTDRLRSTDAKYVEVIHTTAGILGLKDRIGDADFYPNGGTVMPGCGWNVICSHRRSVDYFVETLYYPVMIGEKCNNYEELSRNNCARLETLPMGGTTPKNKQGIYFLETNKQSPFHKIIFTGTRAHANRNASDRKLFEIFIIIFKYSLIFFFILMDVFRFSMVISRY